MSGSVEQEKKTPKVPVILSRRNSGGVEDGRRTPSLRAGRAEETTPSQLSVGGNKPRTSAARPRHPVRMVVCEGTRNNVAPRSARGTESSIDLRPRRRSPQSRVRGFAVVAGRLRGRADFEWHTSPWPSQGLDSPARLRALTDRHARTPLSDVAPRCPSSRITAVRITPTTHSETS
jgi:hypothetical protein